LFTFPFVFPILFRVPVILVLPSIFFVFPLFFFLVFFPSDRVGREDVRVEVVRAISPTRYTKASDRTGKGRNCLVEGAVRLLEKSSATW
jgi:hypothetical protein